jgi:hypothetical protein
VKRIYRRKLAFGVVVDQKPPNYPHKLTKPPVRWPGAAPNCSAAWRPHIAPSESFVSRGARPAAVRQARGAALQLRVIALGRFASVTSTLANAYPQCHSRGTRAEPYFNTSSINEPPYRS